MKNKSVYEKLIAKEAVDNIGIFMQCLLLLALVIVAICSMFIPEFKAPMYMLLGGTFLVMAYNNYRIFKRKGITLIYTLMGVLFVYQTMMMLYGE